MLDDEPERTSVRVNPEPEADERAALEQALARLRAGTVTPGRSAWWRTGVRENVVDAADEQPP